MENKIIMISIAAVIGIILLGSVLMPILDHATATSDTFMNKGYFYVDSVEDDDSITYKFQDGIFTIDGEPVSLPTGSQPTGSQYPDGLTILYTEHICIRYDEGYMKVRGVANHNCFYINVTATNGTITGEYQWTTGDPSTVNWSYTEFVGMADQKTTRVMGTSSSHYINSDSYLETTGLTRFANMNAYYVVHIAGSMDDGITVNLYNQGNGAAITTITITDIQINTTQVDDYEDLYLVDSIMFTASDGTNTDNATYTIYTLPAEVSSDRSVPMPSNQTAILAAIPVMIILAVLLGVVALVIRSRD